MDPHSNMDPHSSHPTDECPSLHTIPTDCSLAPGSLAPADVQDAHIVYIHDHHSAAAATDECPSLHTVVDIPTDCSYIHDHHSAAGSVTPPPHTPSPDHIVVIPDDDFITPISSSTSSGVRDVGPISASTQIVDIPDDDSGLPSGLRSSISSIEAANSVDPNLPWGLHIALSSHAAGSHDTSTPVPNYGKWIELLTLAIIILTGLVSMANTPLPREGPAQRYTRTSLLVALCALLLVLTVIKIALEHIQDRAGWIYYHTKRGHKKIFYWKMIGHILGLLMITCGFSVAAANYIVSKYNEGLLAAYILNMCSLALSAAQNVIQDQLNPKKNDLTERTTNGVIFRELRACRDIPPYYGVGLYEIDPEKMLVLEVD